jgi:acyl-CoA synthetase (AMP-forming)/AMP-acid ligase II
MLRIASSPGAAEVHAYTGHELMNSATELAHRQRLGDQANVVLLLLPHSPELFLMHLGLVLSGKIPAILPWPTTRVDAEKYQRNLLYQLGSLPADCLITLPRLAANLGPGLPYPVSACSIAEGAYFEKSFAERSVASGPAQGPRRRSDVPEGTLFLQFSGGTTGTQKCVAVTGAMLREQVERLSSVLTPTEGDSVASWLPLYHDMGLIACLWFPLLTGIPSIHIAAADWLLRPELLFEVIERYGGSICWLPNFAFSYLAQRRPEMDQQYHLQHVRAWVNCSEPVRRASMFAFADQFADWGVAEESLQASYAMAENVFAVTQTNPRTAPRMVRRAEIRDVRAQYHAKAFELIDDVYVSSGRCLPGMTIRIVRADGSRCDDFEAGEIHIDTPCLFQGYWHSDGLRRDAFTADGWYATGDYGFLADGELYVIGRMKDIIIVAGQNVFPEDVEVIAGRARGVYPGRVVAFGIDDEELGTQSIGVVAEMSGVFDPELARNIETEIRALITAALAIAPRYVSVVQQRWIVKSTAGKISRADTRARFIEERRVAVLT